jgi:hypothetical protein
MKAALVPGAHWQRGMIRPALRKNMIRIMHLRLLRAIAREAHRVAFAFTTFG